MKKPVAFNLLLLITLLTSSGCSSIILHCYGIKTPKQVDQKTILKYASKYNIPESQCYELDTTYYSYVMAMAGPVCGGPTKNHIQPLQALYYNSKKELVSFQINCYAGGFPNLEWNRNDIMKSFPPAQQTPLDTLMPLPTQLTYIKPITQTEKIITDTCDYTVIVFWNRFMGRQSKRLIRYVQNNRKLAPHHKVNILYVNTDNQFAGNLEL